MKSVLGLTALIVALVLISFRPSYSTGGIKANTAYILNIDGIAVAMRAGNAGQLSRYLDAHVDITLPDKSDTYSKSQAEMIIRDFFATNGVQNFVMKNKRENGGSETCIGVLQTRNGDYRTSLFIKQKGDREVLQELRFQAAQ